MLYNVGKIRSQRYQSYTRYHVDNYDLTGVGLTIREFYLNLHPSRMLSTTKLKIRAFDLKLTRAWHKSLLIDSALLIRDSIARYMCIDYFQTCSYIQCLSRSGWVKFHFSKIIWKRLKISYFFMMEHTRSAPEHTHLCNAHSILPLRSLR